MSIFAPAVTSTWPFTPGPQTGNRSHQRALAGAGLAGDENPFARRDHDLGVLDHRGAVVERDREVTQPQRRTRRFAALDPADALAACSRASSETMSEDTRRADAVQSASRG